MNSVTVSSLLWIIEEPIHHFMVLSVLNGSRQPRFPDEDHNCASAPSSILEGTKHSVSTGTKAYHVGSLQRSHSAMSPERVARRLRCGYTRQGASNPVPTGDDFPQIGLSEESFKRGAVYGFKVGMSRGGNPWDGSERTDSVRVSRVFATSARVW